MIPGEEQTCPSKFIINVDSAQENRDVSRRAPCVRQEEVEIEGDRENRK